MQKGGMVVEFNFHENYHIYKKSFITYTRREKQDGVHYIFLNHKCNSVIGSYRKFEKNTSITF